MSTLLPYEFEKLPDGGYKLSAKFAAERLERLLDSMTDSHTSLSDSTHLHSEAVVTFRHMQDQVIRAGFYGQIFSKRGVFAICAFAVSIVLLSSAIHAALLGT